MANDGPQCSTRSIELFYPNTREVFTLRLDNGRTYFIGSGNHDDLVIAHTGIASRHAESFADDESVEVRPHPENTLAINGEPVVADTTLKHGDWLMLGSTLLHVRLVGDVSRRTAVGGAAPIVSMAIHSRS